MGAETELWYLDTHPIPSYALLLDESWDEQNRGNPEYEQNQTKKKKSRSKRVRGLPPVKWDPEIAEDEEEEEYY